MEDSNGRLYTVTEIDQLILQYARGLEELVIPSTITTINYIDFYRVPLLGITLLANTPPNVITDIYVNLNDIYLSVPYDAMNAYATHTFWGNCTDIRPLADISLKVGQWNFISGNGNGVSLNNLNLNVPMSPNYSTSNYPYFTIYETDITTTDYQNCDIAVFDYDYYNNNWSSTGLSSATYNFIHAGEGYFVWPFKENAKGTEITTEGSSTLLLNCLITDSGRVDYTTEPNVGNSTTTENETGYWFAFGNPYNVPINISYVMASLAWEAIGPNIQGKAIYTFDGNGWTELFEDDGGVILPGQGFMVGSAERNKRMNISMYGPIAHSLPANISKTIETENRGIKFSLSANGTESYMYAKQMTEAQDGFDINDAYIMFSTNENKVDPYFVVENNAIKHNRYNSDNYSCAVNFHSQKSGVAELSVSDIPEGTTVSIVDLVMSTETILNDEAYQIEVEAGENANRYQIKINKAGASVSIPQSIENEANISIWNNNKEIFVKGENLQRVEVYNTLGQIVYQKQISGQEYNFTISTKGAYIVKSLSNNGSKTKKIVIK